MTWYHPALAQRALDADSRELAKLKAEIERLRAALEIAVDLLCGARSGFIGGSQPDCEWDSRKERLLREVATLGSADEQRSDQT